MALSAFLDTFVAETNAANNSVRTGYGFQPKAILVWATIATADGYQAGAGISLGFGTGSATSAQRAMGTHFADAVSTTDTGRSYFDGVLGIPTTTAAARLWGARISSLDSDGVTLDWTEVQATGIRVHILALGGSDISNAEVGDFATATATGNQQVPTGFEGKLVLFLPQINTGTAPALGAGGRLNFGAAMSSTKRFCFASNAADAQTMTTAVDAMKQQRSDSCIATLTATATQEALADFVSFDSTPRFTINWTDAPAGANRCAYLLLAGTFQVDLGVFDKTTSAAPVDQDITTPAFDLAALFLASFNNAATNTITADAEVSVGGGDGTREGTAWYQGKDATIPTESNCSIIGTKALRLAESPTTTESEADHSFITNGFRLAWSTNLTSKADQIGYVALGSAPAAAQDTPELRGRPFGLRGHTQMSQLIAQ